MTSRLRVYNSMDHPALPLYNICNPISRHQVHVTRDKITWPGARIRKKGEGMPNYENNNLFGTLYITIDVKFPKGELKDDEKESITKILKMEPVDKVYNGLGGYS